MTGARPRQAWAMPSGRNAKNDGCFSRRSSRACVSNGGGIKGGFAEVLQDKREREEGEVRLSE